MYEEPPAATRDLTSEAWAETETRNTNPMVWVMQAMIQLDNKQIVSSGRAAQRSLQQVGQQQVEQQQVAV